MAPEPVPVSFRLMSLQAKVSREYSCMRHGTVVLADDGSRSGQLTAIPVSQMFPTRDLKCVAR